MSVWALSVVCDFPRLPNVRLSCGLPLKNRVLYPAISFILQYLTAYQRLSNVNIFSYDGILKDGPVESELEVSNAVAGRMSLFYAHATPMLKVLSDTTSKFVTEVVKHSHCSVVYS